MYNHMVSCTGEDHTDLLLHALSDATRRDIVARALGAEHSVSQLAGHYPMSFAAVQKHVAVLQRAGLVIKRQRGREQMVSANLQALQQAKHTLEQLELRWRQRVNQMDRILAESDDRAEAT